MEILPLQAADARLQCNEVVRESSGHLAGLDRVVGCILPNELFEVRLMIEPKAAALAAEWATSSAIAEIREAFGEMTEASRQGVSGVQDLRFHQSIPAASQNALLLQMGNLTAVGLYTSYQSHSKGR